MAVNRADRYPGRWDTETTEYPLGVPKNRTSSTSNDGSYFEKDWISDYEGFFGALMTEAGLTADGTADTATDSQFYDALVAIINSNALDLTTNQTAEGVKTFTESPIVPTPTTDYQAATKEYIDNHKGLAGNYENILDYGDYSSGTFTYPNSHTQDDYDFIIVLTASTNDAATGGMNGMLTNEHRDDYPTSWVVRVQSDSSEYAGIEYASSTSFDVVSLGNEYVRQVIGYLKEGV